MKYLLLIYSVEEAWTNLPEKDRKDLTNEYWAFSQKLQKSGHYLAGEGLKPVSTATTVRVKNGKTLTTDGPFAETREQLGGFYMVEAKDLDEAVGLAAGIPGARIGSVEVRPVMVY